MSKTLFITGATDGIGLVTATKCVQQGHKVCLHGKNPKKLQQVFSSLSKIGHVEKYQADLSDLMAVKTLVNTLNKKQLSLDVLINNAGVLKTPHPITPQGLDIRFAVNTIAPYLLTQGLMPLMNSKGRVINVASAAQAPVNFQALEGKLTLQKDMEAYAQSKLALILWTFTLAPLYPCSLMAVNPGSLLGSKMVKEGFGIEGKDINIGADILIKLALSEDFSHTSGTYFDNDIKDFAPPHSQAFDAKKGEKMLAIIHSILESIEKTSPF